MVPCDVFLFLLPACDSCVHILLDDVEALQRSTTNLSTTLESVSVGMSANNRLEEINQAAINLRVRQPFSGGTCTLCDVHIFAAARLLVSYTG